MLTALMIAFAILLGLAVYLGPIALSTIYWFWGRIENDRFMIRLKNKNFLDIELNSRTGYFTGGEDPIKRWDVRDDKKVDEEKVKTLYGIGFYPVYTAQRVILPINTIAVKRPKQKGEKIIYRILEGKIVTRTPPRFLVHGFETTPVETKGGSGKIGDCKIEDDSDLVAIITETLQVSFEIFNPYSAFIMLPSGEVGQGFMIQLNGTLQSVARQVTAEFSYNEIIKAIVEDGAPEEAVAEAQKIQRKFGARFIALANKNLERYGIRILEIDLLDHSLDAAMAEALQAPQKAYYRAQETITNAEAKKKEKELYAEGDAAEMRELVAELGGDKELIAREIERRGLQRAAEGVGQKFNGQYLTVNFGGGTNQSGPVPAISVGTIEPRKREKKDEGVKKGGNRPHNRDGNKKRT